MAESGPGPIGVDDVGCYTKATTTLLDARRIMAYAAAINDTNPAYFDDTRQGGLNVHPAIVFSLQWNARFMIDRPINRRAAPFGVHAETDLRVFSPFKQGEAVTTQGRTVARRQIPPGVYSVDRYTIKNSRGTLMAELDYIGITRGGILTGDDIQLEPDHPRPVATSLHPEPLWSKDRYIPLHAGQQYTECADIFNPIHTEPSVALAAGLPGVILHGSATKAIALTEVVDHCFDGDATRVTRLYGQLRGMVLMDTTIRIECLGQQMVDGETQVFFQVLNEAGQAAIAGGIVCGRG